MTLKRKPPAGNVRRAQPHGKSSRGVVTNKKGRTVQYESFAQRRLILVFERDRTVADYASQPERIEYRDANGTLRTHFPHFIVWRTDGRVELHEVSYARKESAECSFELLVASSEQSAQSAVRRLCEQRGWDFVQHFVQHQGQSSGTEAPLSTRTGAADGEHTLPDKTELANLRALEYYKPLCYRDDGIAAEVQALLQDSEPVPYGKLLESVGRSTCSSVPHVEETLMHMLWHCELQTNLDKLLFSDGAFNRRALIGLAA